METNAIKLAMGAAGAGSAGGYKLYAWGQGGYGQLGLLGGTSNVSTPVQVGGLTTWSSVSVGQRHTAAIKTDGTLWTWGRNNPNGQLGLGNFTNYTSPMQVGSLTTWSTVTCGGYHTAAIKTDGTLWTWGRNYNGQLGRTTTGSSRNSPVQVGALTNWKSVVGGRYHTMAIKTDGTLWGWGQNTFGQLGNSDSFGSEVSSPVQIGTGTNWSQVTAGSVNSAAIKTDGTLWTWGRNSEGQLGRGNKSYTKYVYYGYPYNTYLPVYINNNASTPVQVGGNTNWQSVSFSMSQYFVAATRTNGTLWTWGRNSQGQLGLVDTNSRSSPSQVGSLTNWKSVATGGGQCIAVKTDKTIWSWGRGNEGQLGLNAISQRESPQQIGSLATWKNVSSGGYAVLATQYL